MRSRKIQAIIYVSGTEDERAIQLKWCHEMCERRRYHVYGIAREKGDSVAWVDAQLLKRSGIVDRIIVYSEDVIPVEGIESVTGDLRGRATRPGPTRTVTPRMRRPRPLR